MQALDRACAATRKELGEGLIDQLDIYERITTAEYFRTFPWWFCNGYAIGVELGKRTKLRCKEDENLIRTLWKRFFPQALSQ